MLNADRVVAKGWFLATLVGLTSIGAATPARACKPGGCGARGPVPAPYAGFGGSYAGYPGFGGAPLPYGGQAYATGYAYPQPAAYQPPVYQQAPPSPTVAQAAPARPAAAQPPAPGSGDDGILLMADKELGGSVNYTLDGNPYEMQPGHTQNLDGAKTWTIRFDRGGSFGQAEYGLSSGAYEWVVTERGWDLRSKTFVATLDNTRNPFEFNFVAADRQEVVAAGQTRTITTKRPLVITFDRGDGREPARVRLTTGTYHVAVDPTTDSVGVFAGPPVTSSAGANPVAATAPGGAVLPRAAAPEPSLPPAPAPAPALSMTAAGN
jgi:hypothetical protein